MKTFKELLIELNACKDAREWAGDRTIEEIVKDSWRGDWLLWLAQRLELPLNKLTLAKARCAKTVIHLMKDQRSINAVNIAERFGRDECTLEELSAAAAAASAAYVASAAAAYAAATDAAAAYAAYAAAVAAAVASAAYVASAYAAYAAAVASAAADKKKNQQQTSDICVEILGELIITQVNKILTSSLNTSYQV
jgi:hypothetical protein